MEQILIGGTGAQNLHPYVFLGGTAIVLGIVITIVLGVVNFFLRKRQERRKMRRQIQTRRIGVRKISSPPAGSPRERESPTFPIPLSRTSSYDFPNDAAAMKPSWNIPAAAREEAFIDTSTVAPHILRKLEMHDVHPIRGFLPPEDPIQRLPMDKYAPWENLSDDLSNLLCARMGQARPPLRRLPVISIDGLVNTPMLKRAHLLLSLFAHAYIWGGEEPEDFIPEGIAVPLWEVSEKLDIPPVLGHPSVVLYNWRRLDKKGAICMENLSTLNNFFGSRDESWFYLITVEIEARGAQSVVPSMLCVDAIHKGCAALSTNDTFTVGESKPGPDLLEQLVRCKEEGGVAAARKCDRNSTNRRGTAFGVEEAVPGVSGYSGLAVCLFVTNQMRHVVTAIRGMTDSIVSMREGCHPFIFYHRVRPFLSAWKQNPTLPNGVVYKGVSEARQQFYGGSAAQSALIPFLDIMLGIDHGTTKSKIFLRAMRDYMHRSHRELLGYIEQVACLREFVETGVRVHLGTFDGNTMDPEAEAQALNEEQRCWLDLQDAYNAAVTGMKDFRSGHINIVAEYIVAQIAKDRGGFEDAAGGKGTGGTDLMEFLKPLRDNCKNAVLSLEGFEGVCPMSGAVGSVCPAGASKAEDSPPVATRREDGKESSRGSNHEQSSSKRTYVKDNAARGDIDMYPKKKHEGDGQGFGWSGVADN